MLNPRRVLTRAQLLDHVWDYDFGGDGRVLETYISYLRKKLDAHGPPLIHTVRGVGYALQAPRALMALAARAPAARAAGRSPAAGLVAARAPSPTPSSARSCYARVDQQVRGAAPLERRSRPALEPRKGIGAAAGRRAGERGPAAAAPGRRRRRRRPGPATSRPGTYGAAPRRRRQGARPRADHLRRRRRPPRPTHPAHRAGRQAVHGRLGGLLRACATAPTRSQRPRGQRHHASSAVPLQRSRPDAQPPAARRGARDRRRAARARRRAPASSSGSACGRSTAWRSTAGADRRRRPLAPRQPGRRRGPRSAASGSR